jgi:NADPH2:quinone reductase
VCKAYGPPSSLVVEELSAVEPGAGEVVIAVKASGVNFPDTLIIEGKYQFKPPPPFTPGGEVAGVISKVGAGVTDVKVGDRVVALMPFGGYAQEVAVAPQQCTPIPAGLDDGVAAALLTAYGTTHYAL